MVFQTFPYWALSLPCGVATGQHGTGCARSLELLIGYTKPWGTQTSVRPPSWFLNQARPCNKQPVLCFLCAANAQDDGVCRLWQSSSLQQVTVGLDSAWPNDLAEINCCQHMVPRTSSSQGQVVWAVYSNCCFKFITGLRSTCFSASQLHLLSCLVVYGEYGEPHWLVSILCRAKIKYKANLSTFGPIALISKFHTTGNSFVHLGTIYPFFPFSCTNYWSYCTHLLEKKNSASTV